MHGHSDSSWSGSILPEITEQIIFHVLFYYGANQTKSIINCIYPSWLYFSEYYFCILVAKSYSLKLEPCVIETSRTLPTFGVSQVTQG